ncbi:hypothetical protein NL676_031061 [Syzygium grande]|nr:hypothetical protein NL676_031061 [Syzygium grande]
MLGEGVEQSPLTIVRCLVSLTFLPRERVVEPSGLPTVTSDRKSNENGACIGLRAAAVEPTAAELQFTSRQAKIMAVAHGVRLDRIWQFRTVATTLPWPSRSRSTSRWLWRNQ